MNHVAQVSDAQFAALSGRVGTLEGQYGALAGQVGELFDLADADRQDSRRGIAAAMALADAPFPSAPGKTSYAARSAVFRGEVAVSATLTHRIASDTPFAVTAGVSYAGGGNTGATVGVAGEF
jgi:autotransporter adhesin